LTPLSSRVDLLHPELVVACNSSLPQDHNWKNCGKVCLLYKEDGRWYW